jgi:hypothetical protein
MARLKGITPRGWEGTGQTWDNVVGSGGGVDTPAIIVANRFNENHGSVNAILHEVAHKIEGGAYQRISASERWMTVFRGTKWDTAYEAKFPEEAFAESFAKYHHSNGTRASLPNNVRLFFEKEFPGA